MSIFQLLWPCGLRSWPPRQAVLYAGGLWELTVDDCVSRIRLARDPSLMNPPILDSWDERIGPSALAFEGRGPAPTVLGRIAMGRPPNLMPQGFLRRSCHPVCFSSLARMAEEGLMAAQGATSRRGKMGGRA